MRKIPMNKIKITPELLSNLKAKAERANPGPWIFDLPYSVLTLKEVWPICDAESCNDAVFIAAANPAVVLALIEKFERLEKELEAAVVKAVKLEEEADWLAEHCEGKDQCPYLAFQWGDPPDNKRPDWCVCTDTQEDGFDCDEDVVECWRKVAREAIAEEEAEIKEKQSDV